MNNIELQKEVFFFPIYKYGTKKYVPMQYALPIAYLVPTLLILLLSPITYTNALLFQIEYIFIALFYGLLGILTRSKLRSFLNIIPAVLSYMTVQFVVQGLLQLKPPINDPYAGFNIASKPIADMIATFSPGNQSVAGYLFIIDLIIIFLIAEIGGFFTAMMSTGFWNPKGQFSVIAVIAKVIAIPFVLIFIIVLPIALHGVNSTFDGIMYVGAGASELTQGFGITSGGQAAQSGFTINDVNISLLRDHSQKAAQYFSFANDKFSQLQGNFILQFVLNAIASSNPQLEGFQNVTKVLDLIGSVSEVSYVLPELFLGFKDLTDGFNKTMPYIGSNSDTYNPNFKVGLKSFTYAFGNLTLAWEKTNNKTNAKHGLKEAIDYARSLEDVPQLANYVNINKFINATDSAITGLLSMNQAFIQFLNGTYKITIGMKNLAENKLNSTNYWIDLAINDFILSNATLSNIPTPPMVNFEFYPNGDGGKSQIQSVPIPIAGFVNIAKDLNNLLIRFAYAGLDSIDMLLAMDDTLTSIGSLQWNNTVSSANSAYWESLSNGLLSVNDSYNNGLRNITEAGNLANEYKNKSYGSMLDPIFVTGKNSFFSQLATQVFRLQSNFTDYGYLLQAFTTTTLAYQHFSYGSDLFNNWLTTYQGNGNTTNSATDNYGNQSLANFTLSANYAYAGYVALGHTVGLNQHVKTSWQNSLYDEANNNTLNDHSLTGADHFAITMLSTPNSVVTQLFISILQANTLGSIFGKG